MIIGMPATFNQGNCTSANNASTFTWIGAGDMKASNLVLNTIATPTGATRFIDGDTQTSYIIYDNRLASGLTSYRIEVTFSQPSKINLLKVFRLTNHQTAYNVNSCQPALRINGVWTNVGTASPRQAADAIFDLRADPLATGFDPQANAKYIMADGVRFDFRYFWEFASSAVGDCGVYFCK